PKRGLGDKSVEQLQDYAREAALPLFDALPLADSAGVGTAAARKMREFHALVGDLRATADRKPLAELVDEVLGRSGYRAALEREDTDEAADRLGNLQELV